jgi:hypothetical protein
MRCEYPQSKEKTHKGTKYTYSHACGQCLACRITKSQNWTLRIELEARCHEWNSFITLTYNEESRPEGHSISKKELQDFFKRLRKNSGRKFRYYACGEYGKLGREHYHAILFGWPPSEISEIEKAWTDPDTKKTKGFAQCLPFDTGAAAYVAGYVTKKLANTDYPEGKLAPFALMSRGRRSEGEGGIGYKYAREIVNNVERDKLNLVGEDMTAMRIGGRLMPTGDYLQKIMNESIGYTPLEKSISQSIVISTKDFWDMNFPEAKNHEREVAAKKARVKIKLRKMRETL